MRSCTFLSSRLPLRRKGTRARWRRRHDLLVAAENPVIVAGRVGRTEAGAAHLKELR